MRVFLIFVVFGAVEVYTVESHGLHNFVCQHDHSCKFLVFELDYPKGGCGHHGLFVDFVSKSLAN
jgi:hypothetical protein